MLPRCKVVHIPYRWLLHFPKLNPLPRPGNALMLTVSVYRCGDLAFSKICFLSPAISLPALFICSVLVRFGLSWTYRIYRVANRPPPTSTPPRFLANPPGPACRYLRDSWCDFPGLLARVYVCVCVCGGAIPWKRGISQLIQGAIQPELIPRAYLHDKFVPDKWNVPRWRLTDRHVVIESCAWWNPWISGDWYFREVHCCCMIWNKIELTHWYSV